MSVARCAAEHGDDDVRPECPNDAHDVAEDRVLRPVPERLCGRLREAEVICAREELSCAIDAPRGEQLLSANDAECFTKFVADGVLSAVAARERQVCDIGACAACQPAEQLCVFIIGMGADHEDACRGAERAGEIVQRDGALLRACRCGKTDGDQCNCCMAWKEAYHVSVLPESCATSMPAPQRCGALQ